MEIASNNEFDVIRYSFIFDFFVKTLSIIENNEKISLLEKEKIRYYCNLQILIKMTQQKIFRMRSTKWNYQYSKRKLKYSMKE